MVLQEALILIQMVLYAGCILALGISRTENPAVCYLGNMPAACMALAFWTSIVPQEQTNCRVLCAK